MHPAIDLAIVDTSKYGDPLGSAWSAAARYAVSYLRLHGARVALVSRPTVPEQWSRSFGTPAAVYFELGPDNASPELRFLENWRRALPNACILVGGPLATAVPDSLLFTHPELDGVIVGECETGLLGVTKRLRSGRGLCGLPNVWLRGAPCETRARVEDMDDLALMARDGLGALFDAQAASERAVYLLSSRGCYGRCAFCSVPMTIGAYPGPTWRARSVDLVVQEMESFYVEHGVRRFIFQDDNFFGRGVEGRERSSRMSALIRERCPGVSFFFACRVSDVEVETFTALKSAGLVRVGLGVESVSARSLSLLGKGYRPESIPGALALLEELGIGCEVNLIFFEPTMTLHDVRKNLDFVESLNEYENVTYSDGYPFRALDLVAGTPIAASLRRAGALTSDGMLHFLDPRVGQVAAFAARLQQMVPIFKRRSLLRSEDAVMAARALPALSGEVERQTAIVRQWLGLKVLPALLRRACDAVEREPEQAHAQLAELTAEFARSAASVHGLGQRLEALAIHSARGAAPIPRVPEPAKS